MSKVVKTKPDLIVLSGVAPADAPLLIKAGRELGFNGIFSAPRRRRTPRSCAQVAGDKADGFICVGGASHASDPQRVHGGVRQRYAKGVGEWNDEAGTKVYALEIILATLQKQPQGHGQHRRVQEDHAGVRHAQPVRQGPDQAQVCRHQVLRAAAPDRRADGGERVPRRHVPDPVRRVRSKTSDRSLRNLSAPCRRRSSGTLRAMEDLLGAISQILVNGLVTGSIYALIALGLTLIFGIMRVVNFAHGQMYMLGAFVVYYVYAEAKVNYIAGAAARDRAGGHRRLSVRGPAVPARDAHRHARGEHHAARHGHGDPARERGPARVRREAARRAAAGRRRAAHRRRLSSATRACW